MFPFTQKYYVAQVISVKWLVKAGYLNTKLLKSNPLSFSENDKGIWFILKEKRSEACLGRVNEHQHQ